jgi:hypothetical protein
MWVCLEFELIVKISFVYRNNAALTILGSNGTLLLISANNRRQLIQQRYFVGYHRISCNSVVFDDGSAMALHVDGRKTLAIVLLNDAFALLRRKVAESNTKTTENCDHRFDSTSSATLATPVLSIRCKPKAMATASLTRLSATCHTTMTVLFNDGRLMIADRSLTNNNDDDDDDDDLVNVSDIGTLVSQRLTLLDQLSKRFSQLNGMFAMFTVVIFFHGRKQNN